MEVREVAGDWIKMRIDLWEDPAVMEMAEKLEVREEVIVGYLHKVWSWVSRQCNDGTVTSVSLASLGRVTNLPGFPEMMAKVGWLNERIDNGKTSIVIPHFNRHLSQSAKSRALAKERQKQKRNGGVTKPSRSQRDVSVTREEKRREEKKKEKKTKEKRVCFKKPTIPEIKMYCLERKNKVDPESFFDFYESKGWKVGANQMKDWHAAVRTWEKRETQDSQSKATKSRVPTAEDLKHYNPHSPTGLDPGYIPEELR